MQELDAIISTDKSMRRQELQEGTSFQTHFIVFLLIVISFISSYLTYNL